MNLKKAVEIKHFDKDGDGHLSEIENERKDAQEQAALSSIENGLLEGSVDVELVDDLFLIQLFEQNVNRQKQRRRENKARPRESKRTFL